MSHTHADGTVHHGSHGPEPQAQQVQQIVPPPPDPEMQALIEQDFQTVPLALLEDNSVASCGAHSLEKCIDCDVDFVNMNRLSRLLVMNPNLMCPPPPQVLSQQMTAFVTKTKEEGNAAFKSGNHPVALGKYSHAAHVAMQRPPWEASHVMREELSTLVSNRSASFLEAGDLIGALVDAETVISIRRNWPKGHFRKAKALLMLGVWEEARDAVQLGLQYEPTNAELVSFLGEIERVGEITGDRKALTT